MANSTENKTIKIQTTRFGELEVAESAVINIFAGLIGFPQAKNYVILEYSNPFSWLQSTDVPDLAFVVVNAAEFGENYVFELPFGDRDLALTPDGEVAIFNLVSIRADARQSTVNLKAPVVVNLDNRKARQIILDDPRFPTRMALWADEASEEAEKSGDK